MRPTQTSFSSALVLLFALVVPLSHTATAQGQSETHAFTEYKKYIARNPFVYQIRGRMALARTRDAKPLDELVRDYRSPVAHASERLTKDEVQDYARYLMVEMFARFYNNWTWADRFASLRKDFKTPQDSWLWANTLAIDGREENMREVLSVARTADDIFLRASAIESMARYQRSEVLQVIPEVCAAFPKPKKLDERRLLVGALSSAILANKEALRSEPMQKAIRAYIGLLHEDVKLEHSCKMVVARHLAKTIGKDRRYIEPEPWIQLLDQGFEPPNRAGHTVTTMRFFGIEAEGDRLCYLVDMSNSMLKPIDPGLIPKGPTTGPKKKRKRGQLPTEDDIPWHLVKSRFDLARWHLKISIQRLSKDKRFCVVWFGDQSGLLKSTPGMIKATRGNQLKVIKELDSIKPGPVPRGVQARDAPHGWLRGQTNVHGGFRRAFAMHSRGFAPRYEHVDRKALAEGCDTIFLLSDGAPSSDDFVLKDVDYKDMKVVAELEYGREVARPDQVTYHGPLDQPNWLRTDIQRMNLFRKVQIHCVGIGEADIGLLRGIADDTDGQVYLFGAKAKAAGRSR